MANYVLCPRCELNFIDADEQEFCEVCVKELSGEKTFTDDFEAEEATEETDLCPICGENYMVFGEKMCEECKGKNEYEAEETGIDDEDEDGKGWREYLDDEDEDMEELGIPDTEFESEEEEEEEEEEQSEEDEFEYVSADDYYELDDEDEDEDEDDDEDDF